MEIRRVTSSSPCLMLVLKVERNCFKSASGASKFIPLMLMWVKPRLPPKPCSSARPPLPPSPLQEPFTPLEA
eukprot:1160902-Pelagomonas_calceolata.AAC.9